MTQAFRVPIIMMYHSVRRGAGGGIYRIAINADRFDRHIDFLASRYRIVPLLEFVAALASKAKTEGMACITFDDGFVDNLTVASEILRKHRTPATVFIPTGFVGRPYFWWDGLYAVSTGAAGRTEFTRTELRKQLADLDFDREGGESEWFTPVWDYLRRRPLDESYHHVNELAARFDADLANLPRPVTAKELQKFAEWPFEVGSHAVSHRPLPSLSIAEATKEITESRAYLESQTGRQVRSFSYPFGLLDRDVTTACRDTGYLCAVSVSTSRRLLSYVDVFDLPRVDGADGDVDELASDLGVIEERNLRNFATARPVAPTPVEISPERRRTFSSANNKLLRPLQFRGGDFFSAAPISRVWGYDRGTPLDRPYIENFIRTHAGDVHGHVLEIKGAEYSKPFARPGAQIDILDIDPGNIGADIIDDLQTCEKIDDNTYDCIILTQVLQLIPDFERAIATAARILRPGGVLLLTVPGITQSITTNEGEFLWSFFKTGIKRLLSKHFDEKKLLVESHGNVGLAASFLMGLSTADVPPDLFSFHDSEYPIVVSARAEKPLPIPERLRWSPAVENPSVSIIIPMFNAERTIKETLFSISRQTHESYEVLIVDDGSTDNSRKIVEDYERESGGRITMLQHGDSLNLGLSQSRNLAMEHARGDFIVFLDSDDTIHPEKLAHDLAILKANSDAAAVVGRALWWWDGSGHQDAHLDIIFEPADRVLQPPSFFNATYQTEAGGVPPCVHSWMIRKAVLKKIEPFDPQVMTYEDQKFFAELSLRYPVYVSSTCLCDYRRKEVTLWATAVASGSDTVARSRFLEWRSDAAKTSPAYR
jgi:peptidoglycan/xylan/chitin deacetylase (PgdA/CDA1 family)/SAM-dependent methyltransferase